MISIYDPLEIILDINQAADRKVLRFFVRILAYNHVCFHIGGDEKLWADLLTCYSTHRTILFFIPVRLLPTTFQESDLPSAFFVCDSQNNHANSLHADAVLINAF